MIWLNHTCYNGLYRVNREGRFNVPFGYYENAFVFDPANLRAASQALKASQAELCASDYSHVLDLAVRGDVAYFDPPYQPPDQADGFTDYTAGGFGPTDQAKLASVVQQLQVRGCRPLLSNSDAADIRELYRGMACRELLVPRAINSNGSKRGRVTELLFYPRNRATLHDLWGTVVDRSGWSLDSNLVFHVTSRQVKALTGQEPRLVAKMDTREELPDALLKKGYFVLPESANKYAVVPGDGYHDLEQTDLDPIAFVSDREVPVTIALKAGESAAIQTALYSGLLEEVVGVPRLRETLHNDLLQLRDTEISYGSDWSLLIDGARVELDAGFENHREFFVFECKHWYRSQLRNFNVRQLFFPYLLAQKQLRAQNRDWRVRCFFLNVEPDTATYRFWEYAFGRETDYSAIRKVAQWAFKLAQPRAGRAQSALERLMLVSQLETTYLPQANDPTKVLSLIQGIAEGVSTPNEIADRLRFVGRQSHYYGEAAEELGFISRRPGSFSLTADGERLAAMRTDEATRLLIERIFALPVFREIAEAAIESGVSTVEAANLEPSLIRQSKGRYSGSTIRRRAQSVQSWLNWIGETTGTIRVRSAVPSARRRRTLDSY